MLLTYAVTASFGLICLAILCCAYRLFQGPDILDRVVALDTININAIGLILLGGILWSDDVFFEAALLIAMMGFVGTVGISKFVLRGTIIE